MKSTKKPYSILFLILLMSIRSTVSAETLRKIMQIDLPGASGKRFDYLKIDYQDHYVFSAHLGADQIYILDKSGKLIKTVKDTPGVEGIEFVPELNKIYTSNWRDHTIGVIDLKQMKVIKKIPAEKKPDGSAYAAFVQKLYVSDELAKSLIIVDVKTDQIIKTLRFQSETGMPQFDPVAKKIYLNLQDQNTFVVIDPFTDSVQARYPLSKCKGNHGMTLDPDRHLAFLACEGNDLLSVFDLDKHSELATMTIPSGVDVIAYDPGMKRLYAACYSGFISVLQVKDGTHLEKLEDVKVQPKVHSLAIDIETHRVYAPEQDLF